MNVKKASQPYDLSILSEIRIIFWLFRCLSQLVKYVRAMQSFSESLKFFQIQEQQICNKMHGKEKHKVMKNGDNGKPPKRMTCVAKELYDEPVSNESLISD